MSYIDNQKKIIKKVSNTLEIEEEKVEACLNHACFWIKNSMMDYKYDQIRWPKLGTFTRLKINKNVK